MLETVLKPRLNGKTQAFSTLTVRLRESNKQLEMQTYVYYEESFNYVPNVICETTAWIQN